MLGPGEVQPPARLLKAEGHLGEGLLQGLLEEGPSLGVEEELPRVLGGEADGVEEEPGGELQVQALQGGLLPGLVGVKGQVDLQDPRLLEEEGLSLGEARAQHGHRLREAQLVEGDGVKEPLHHDGPALPQGGPGLGVGEEDLLLAEKGVSGVFRYLGPSSPRALPVKATTRPKASLMGKVMRWRRRSTKRPCRSASTPARTPSSGATPCRARKATSPSPWAGRSPGRSGPRSPP